MAKTVLITGTSSGFGSNTAEALAREGWTVFAAMRNVDKGRALEERVRSAGGQGSLILVELDVTDLQSVDRAVALVGDATGGTLDALLNNAGFSIFGAFEDLSDADCRQQMETNFFGVLNVTRAVLPMMRRAGRGRIAIVTSNAVNAPHPLITMYAASKWALEGWAEGLAMEVAPFGIDIAVVQPGAHRTPFAQNVVPVVPEGSAYAPWVEAVGASVAKLDRWGRDPERATQTLVEAVSKADMPFRTALGEDTAVFAALKGALPYEVRSLLLRAIINAPAPGSFVSQAVAPTDETRDQVAAQLSEAMAPAMISALSRFIATSRAEDVVT